MSPKKIHPIEGQRQIFDPDAPVQSPDLDARREEMKNQASEAELAGIPATDVRTRHEKLLSAIDSFAEISKLRGLGRIAATPELSPIFEDRSQSYSEGVLATKIVPAADKKWRKTSKNELNNLVSDIVGDVDAARASAWADFTDAERARMSIDPSNMDADELQANLRATFAGRDGAKNREKYRKNLGPKQKAA